MTIEDGMGDQELLEEESSSKRWIKLISYIFLTILAFIITIIELPGEIYWIFGLFGTIFYVKYFFRRRAIKKLKVILKDGYPTREEELQLNKYLKEDRKLLKPINDFTSVVTVITLAVLVIIVLGALILVLYGWAGGGP